MIGCLCLHGFTGGPYEIEPITEYLKENTDWVVSVPTYPGHGKELSLKGRTHDEWLNEAETAYLELQKRVNNIYIVGFSMGGMIAGYLASKYGCDKLILLNASAYYVNPGQMIKDIADMMISGLSGQLKDHELFKRYKKKFKDTPFRATREFRKLVKLVKPEISQVSAPTLIVQGECDSIVPRKSAEYLYNAIAASNKRICYFKESKHMICHDVERDQLIDEVYQFLMSE
jgi:carboxylesterase